jgi:hypothetical protein
MPLYNKTRPAKNRNEQSGQVCRGRSENLPRDVQDDSTVTPASASNTVITALLSSSPFPAASIAR